MLEWFAQWGPDIIIGLLGLTGIYTSIRSIVMTVRNNKKFNKQLAEQQTEMKKEVEITREGVIEAFKQAILGNDFKISINNQLDKKLSDGLSKFVETITKNEELRTKLTVYNAMILKNTAAYNKLTNEEKAEMDMLMTNLGESINIEVEDDIKGE